MGRLMWLAASSVLLMSLVVGPLDTVHAIGPSAHYLTGWNMVGGQSGDELSLAQLRYTYDSDHGYILAGNSATSPCQGEWAYFASPITLPIVSGATVGSPQACDLHSGWNLVGNPFSAPADVSGAPLYHWNPNKESYDIVSQIPVGGAAWLYSTTASTVSVTALQSSGAPTPTTTPPTGATIVITRPFESEYWAHVGDTVELLLANPPGYTAAADPTYLRLLDSGAAQSSPIQQFWRWRAVAPGRTSIVVDLGCRTSVPPCEAPTREVTVVILP